MNANSDTPYCTKVMVRVDGLTIRGWFIAPAREEFETAGVVETYGDDLAKQVQLYEDGGLYITVDYDNIFVEDWEET